MVIDPLVPLLFLQMFLRVDKIKIKAEEEVFLVSKKKKKKKKNSTFFHEQLHAGKFDYNVTMDVI